MQPLLFDMRLGSMRERLRKGRLVLAVYPIFAVVAAMVLLDGHAYWMTKAFLTACLLYPLVYFGCLDAALVLRTRRRRVAALVVSGLPLQYLGGVAVFAVLTLIVEGTPE